MDIKMLEELFGQVEVVPTKGSEETKGSAVRILVPDRKQSWDIMRNHPSLVFDHPMIQVEMSHRSPSEKEHKIIVTVDYV